MAATTTKPKPPGNASAKGKAGRKLWVVATNACYAKICREAIQRLPPSVRRRVGLLESTGWRDVDWNALRTEAGAPALVVSRMGDVPDDAAVSGTGGERKHLLFVEDLPVEALSTRVTRLNVRDPRKLHIARKRDERSVAATIRRAIGGLTSGGGRAAAGDFRRIVDAWIEGETLVLLAPSFERLSVPVDRLKPLLGENAAAIGTFEIDEDGSFLYWPHADAHLGWEQLERLVDPAAALKAQQRTTDFNRRYGAAIRSLREERGIRQSAVPGLTERHLRRIEHGEIRATRSAIQSLAAAHELDLSEYMRELAERLKSPRAS